MKDTVAALRWVKSVLEKNKIAYQVVGGLAAKAYGAKRDLWDIDIYIPGTQFNQVCSLVKEYIVWGPGMLNDEHWRCEFVKLEYAGQKIEFGNSDNTQRYDAEEKTWIKEHIDYACPEFLEIFGCFIPVIPKKDLIIYKRKLGRDVDLQDLIEIENSH